MVQDFQGLNLDTCFYPSSWGGVCIPGVKRLINVNYCLVQVPSYFRRKHFRAYYLQAMGDNQMGSKVMQL